MVALRSVVVPGQPPNSIRGPAAASGSVEPSCRVSPGASNPDGPPSKLPSPPSRAEKNTEHELSVAAAVPRTTKERTEHLLGSRTGSFHSLKEMLDGIAMQTDYHSKRIGCSTTFSTNVAANSARATSGTRTLAEPPSQRLAKEFLERFSPAATSLDAARFGPGGPHEEVRRNNVPGAWESLYTARGAVIVLRTRSRTANAYKTPKAKPPRWANHATPCASR